MKFKIALILFLFFLFPAMHLYCQQDPIDALNGSFKNAKHDTAKARILVALTEELAALNMDTVIPVCEKALAIIEKNFERADAFEQRSFLGTRAYAFSNIGFIYNNRGDMTTALDYYQRALQIQQEMRARYPDDIANKRALAYSYNNIGYVYDNHGDIPKALDYYHKSLKTQEEIGDKKGMAYSFNNIGFIYNAQDDIPKALEYYHKSLKIREELKDKQGIANSLNNLGSIYNKQAVKTNDLEKKANLFSKALDYFQRSLNIQEDLGSKRGIAYSFNNIGGVYNKQANEAMSLHIRGTDSIYKKALDYYLKSLIVFKEIGDKKGVAATMDNIGSIYINLANAETSQVGKEKNYKLAEEYCWQSLQLSKELGFPENIREAAKSLYLIYKDRKDGLKALEFHELYMVMKDSINNVETQKEGVKRQMQYEFDKKEALIKEEQARVTAIADEERKRQQLFLVLVCFIALAISVIAILVFRSLRITRKQKEIIEKQKHLVEEKQKEILDSIRYAKRIQTALLPTEKFVGKVMDRIRKK